MSVSLGIDFEDITHTPAYRNLNDNPDININIVDITNRLIRLFNRYEATATFFIVGEMVSKFPETINRIAASGHEIASHTHTHVSLTKIEAESREVELRKSKIALEDVLNSEIDGIRAPTCKINNRVHEDISAQGYKYSSSVMPTLPIPGFYSTQYAQTSPFVQETPAGEVIEVPLSVHPNVRLPLSGAWMRMLGQRYTLHGIESLLNNGVSVVTYSHPWEFANLQETVLPRRNRIRTGEWMFKLYESILEKNEHFVSIGSLINNARK